MVVVHIAAHDSPLVGFSEYEDVIEALAAQGSN
jgi:hypothetical protein